MFHKYVKLLIAAAALLTSQVSHGLADAAAPTKIQIPFANSAGGAYVRTVPIASQIGIQNGAASYTDGFPPLNFTPINAGGVPPFGQDMNGVLRDVSAHARWWAAGGPVYYDGTYQTAIGGYPKGAIVQSAVTTGLLWVSTTENNTTNPDAAGAGWIHPDNTVYAPLTGAGASGTWGINITGNAATANSATSATSATSAASLVNGTGSVVLNNGSFGAMYRPSVHGSADDHTWTDASGTFLMGLTSSGALTTVSFNGAGTGLTGTASGLSIGGNAATATNATNVVGSGTISGTTTGGAGLSVASSITAGTSGSFTAALVPDTGSITLDTAYQIYWTVIGNRIFFDGYVHVSSVSAPTGNLRLTGFPHVSIGTAGVAVLASGLKTTATTAIMGAMNQVATDMTIYKFSAGSTAGLASDVQAGTYFQISGNYRF